jgi:hypothetical protein
MRRWFAGEFGCFKLSPDGKYVLFAAEAPEKKKTGYFDAEVPWEDAEAVLAANVVSLGVPDW